MSKTRPSTRPVRDTDWVVEVVSYEDNKVTHRIPCGTNERRADRVDDGMQHNLDHDRFYTRIKPPKQKQD